MTTHTIMKTCTAAGLLTLAGITGAVVAPVAGAATSSDASKHASKVQYYVHQTPGAATKAHCLATRAADVKLIRGLSKTSSVVAADQCRLAGPGWQANIWYKSGIKLNSRDLLTRDVRAGQMLTYHYTHGTGYASSKANATAHMNWTLSKLKAKPNDAVVTSAQVLKNAGGTYSYVVAYDAKANRPFFAEDRTTMQVD